MTKPTWVKMRPNGEFYEYPNRGVTVAEAIAFDQSWIVNSRPDIAQDAPGNIMCSCGNRHFRVEWWDYPYTGGYCKLHCPECGNEIVLIDDFA